MRHLASALSISFSLAIYGCNTDTHSPPTNTATKPLKKASRPKGSKAHSVATEADTGTIVDGSTDTDAIASQSSRNSEQSDQPSRMGATIETMDTIKSESASFTHVAPNLTSGLQIGLREPGLDGNVYNVNGLSICDGNEDGSNVVPVVYLEGDSTAGHLMALKYGTNCGFQAATDPNVLIRNYNFITLIQRQIRDDGSLVPMGAPYLSGPATITVPAMSHRGLVFQSSDACLSAEVRFIVQGMAGQSLRTFVRTRGPFPLLSALKTGLSLVKKMVDLHSHGIIHGDIHWGNVLFRDPDSRAMKFVLVDWDRAQLDGRRDTLISTQGLAPAWYQSPNELRGGEVSYQNDLYRIYELMGAIINGVDYYVPLANMDARALIAHKMKTNLLTHSGTNKVYKGLIGQFHSLVTGVTKEAFPHDLAKEAERVMVKIVQSATPPS